MKPVELIAGSAAMLTHGAWVGVLADLVPPTAAMAASAATMAGLGGLLVAASARPGLQLFGPAVVRGPVGGDRVALTFDDGPDPASTPALLDALARADARATFFVLVENVERHPQLLKDIAARHEVALHGWGHDAWLTLRAPDRGAAELQRAADRLAQHVGEPVRWYRPPFGVTSPRLAQALSRTDLQMAWCSVRTLDGGPMSPKRLRARCARASAGDILLLHEGRQAAVQALQGILGDLRDRGLSPVTLGELLEDQWTS